MTLSYCHTLSYRAFDELERTMARKPITISVPDWLQSYIEDRVKGGGYGSVSEYFRELLRIDRQHQINLMNSMNSAIRFEPGTQPKRPFRPLASAARRPR